MNEALESMINAVGALAEVCYLFYSRLVDQGFSEWHALELTKQLVIACTTARSNTSEGS